MNVLPYWSDKQVAAVAARLSMYGADGRDMVRHVLHEAEALPAEHTKRAVRWLDRFGGHLEDCNTLSGAPECSCGWDEAYTEIRAAVRSGALPLPRTDQPKET